MRVTLIHNPGAGDEEQPDANALQALLERHGHSVRYQSGADSSWHAVLEERADVIAVAGGDGTVGRVAKKLAGRNLALAPLPLGTANNISRTLGLLDLTLDEIVEGWRNDHHVRFDVGIANGPWGVRYFVEAMGIGIFARTIPAADRSRALAKLKDAESKVAYAIGMLRARLDGCPPHRLRIALDGRRLEGDYVLFEAMNMEFVGPNLYLAPDIEADDGRLDVVLVTTAERDKLHDTLANWQAGNLHPPDLTRYRAARVTLDWTDYPVHFDDEAWPPEDGAVPPALSPIELSVERGAIDFLAPGVTLEK